MALLPSFLRWAAWAGGTVPTMTQISPYLAVQRSAMRCSISRQGPRLRAGRWGAMFVIWKVRRWASGPKRVAMAWLGTM